MSFTAIGGRRHLCLREHARRGEWVLSQNREDEHAETPQGIVGARRRRHGRRCVGLGEQAAPRASEESRSQKSDDRGKGDDNGEEEGKKAPYSVALIGDFNHGCDLNVAAAKLIGFAQVKTVCSCSGPLADDYTLSRFAGGDDAAEGCSPRRCHFRAITSMFENDGPSVVKWPIFSAIAAVSGSELLASAASLDGNVTITTCSPVPRSRPRTSLV